MCYLQTFVAVGGSVIRIPRTADFLHICSAHSSRVNDQVNEMRYFPLHAGLDEAPDRATSTCPQWVRVRSLHTLCPHYGMAAWLYFFAKCPWKNLLRQCQSNPYQYNNNNNNNNNNRVWTQRVNLPGEKGTAKHHGLYHRVWTCLSGSAWSLTCLEPYDNTLLLLTLS